MPDILRIVIYLVCFSVSAYALSGINFQKVMKNHSEAKIQILYIFLSMSLAYLVGQFIMGISRYGII